MNPFRRHRSRLEAKIKSDVKQATREVVDSVRHVRVRFSCLLNTVGMSEPDERPSAFRAAFPCTVHFTALITNIIYVFVKLWRCRRACESESVLTYFRACAASYNASLLLKQSLYPLSRQSKRL